MEKKYCERGKEKTGVIYCLSKTELGLVKEVAKGASFADEFIEDSCRFKYFKGNALFKPNNELLNSLKEKGFIPTHFITISLDGYILEGQHRFYYCKLLGIEPYYMIKNIYAKDFMKTDFAVDEITLKKKTPLDWIEYYSCFKFNPNYIRIRDIMKMFEYTQLDTNGGFKQCLFFGHNIKGQGDIQNGRTIINEEDDKKTREFIKLCYSLDGLRPRIMKNAPIAYYSSLRFFFEMGIDTKKLRRQLINYRNIDKITLTTTGQIGYTYVLIDIYYFRCKSVEEKKKTLKKAAKEYSKTVNVKEKYKDYNF